MREKRGQAALEFLMTYGWAILVVLVVIGALAYFGVLNPNTLVPEKCTLQTGIACKDYQVKTDQVALAIENGMGKGIYISNTTITQIDGGGNCHVEYNLTVLNGASAEFTADCSPSIEDSGRKVKLGVELEYYFQDSSADFTHTAEGEILARIES